MDGWVDGLVGGWESEFKDCLQQSKTGVMAQMARQETQY